MGSKRLNSTGSSSPPPQNGLYTLGGGGGASFSPSSSTVGSSTGGGHHTPPSSSSASSASASSRSVLRRVAAALGLSLLLVLLLTFHMHLHSLEQLAERRHYIEFLQGASSLLLLHGQPQDAPPLAAGGAFAAAVPGQHGVVSGRAITRVRDGGGGARELRSRHGSSPLLRGHDGGHSSGHFGNVHISSSGSEGVASAASLVGRPVDGGSSGPVRRGGGGVDAVAGMAAHIDPKYLAVFLLSLRRVSPSSDVVLFVDATTARDARVLDIVARADAMAAAAYASSSSAGGGSGGGGSTAAGGPGRIILSEFDDVASFPEHMQRYHASSKRWALLHKHFQPEEVRARYRFIMLVDVRDTAFQRDPFAATAAVAAATVATHKNDAGSLSPSASSASASVFLTFTDDERITLAQCGWNAGWVKDCFGHEMLDRIGGEGIVCSGVSVGSADAVWEYLRRMHTIISRKDSSDASSVDGYALPASLFPQCERNGVDQGVHNVLMRSPGVFPDRVQVRVWAQGEGPVVNMQSQVYAFDQAAATAAVARSRGTNGGIALLPRSSQAVGFPEVLTQSSAPGLSSYGGQTSRAVAVAHQYDRDSAVQAALFKQYVYWMDTADPMAEWAAEPACARFAPPEADVDLFKGVCDLEDSGGATSPAACCSRCVDGKCGGFVFLGSMCFLKAAACPATSRTHVALPGALSAFARS